MSEVDVAPMNWGDPRMPERFWDKVQPEPNSGCWLWLGTVTQNGYGHVWSHNKNVRPHRLTYEAFIGPIPEGLVIDHLCCVIVCCNPAHLEATTDRVNILRSSCPPAENARKTTCINGHPFTSTDRRGYRKCIVCAREHQRRWALKNPRQPAARIRAAGVKP